MPRNTGAANVAVRDRCLPRQLDGRQWRTDFTISGGCCSRDAKRAIFRVRREIIAAALLTNLDRMRCRALRPGIRDGRHRGRHRVQEGKKYNEAGKQLVPAEAHCSWNDTLLAFVEVAAVQALNEGRPSVMFPDRCIG